MMASLKCAITEIKQVVTLLLFLHAVRGRETKDDWHHHKILGDNFSLYWRVHETDISFQLEVATKGWIGFGLSPSGDIAGSDLAIGWVNGNKTFLYDFYAVNSATIYLDKSQDLKAVSGFENKTHTVLRFSRKLDTCDPRDWVITNDTQMVLYASYPEDPKSPNDIPYSLTVWNTRLFKLLQPRRIMIPIPEDLSYWDLRADNYTLPPNRSTFYYCKMFRSPVSKQKHHIIKIAAVIRPQNQNFVHHLCIYQCHPANIQEGEEAVAVTERNCLNPSLPVIFSTCRMFTFCWGLDGGDFLYPTHVGQPLGGNSVPEYWKLEIHYDYSFKTGITDDSGLRYYYTPHLRKYDSGGIFVQPSTISPALVVIPPQQREFIVASHGTPQCLSQGLPRQGIKVFAAFLHTHMLGKKIRIRHFRKNRELRPIMEDLNYRNIHQEYQFLPRDVTVLPGDHLVTECSMDSRERMTSTFFGLTTHGEMCGMLLFYYPPMRITLVESNPPIELLAGLTGMSLNSRNCSMTVKPENQRSFGKLKSDIQNSSSSMNAFHQDLTQIPYACYQDYFNDYNWPQKDLCTIQNALRYSPHIVHCRTSSDTYIDVPRGTYPENIIPYRDTGEKCKNMPEKRVFYKMRQMMSSCAEEVTM